MKIVRHLLIIALLFFSLGSASSDESFLTSIMSFNVRYSTAPDGLNSWEYRKNILARAIKSRLPDILCLQEVLTDQLDFIQKQFPEYSWFGEPTFWDKKVSDKVYTPILYKTDLYTSVDNGQFWLSETPDKPSSKSWNTYFSRPVTWIQLENKHTKKTFYVFNVHLDHVSRRARLKGSVLLLERIQKICKFEQVIVAGDINEDARKRIWNILNGKSEIFGLRSPLRDASILNGQTKLNDASFHMFSGKNIRVLGRSDWILVSPEIKVLDFAMVHYNEDGRYPSDHFPVMAYLEIL